MADFELVRRGYELTTVPERGGWLNREQISHRRHHEDKRCGNPVPKSKSPVIHLFSIFSFQTGKCNKKPRAEQIYLTGQLPGSYMGSYMPSRARYSIWATVYADEVRIYAAAPCPYFSLREKRNSRPPPFLFSALTSPLWKAMALRTIDRPRPDPPSSRVLPSDTR